MKINNLMGNINLLDSNKQTEKNSVSFGEVLNNQLKNLEDLQSTADNLTEKMVTGEVQDLSKVMIATEEATIALQMTVQIRNKVVEAYQEVSRMQL
ncbi:flagellar hook-basal body complex protein FliE [Clostridium grantii]|uniref:Flagellar hook-basal body complex protein FliE n=1 Tax=Clostridium grantii DSM 8605 TaxID=1121316 RepID=A0A1M5W8R1_9CLOT|nr:flagellar hook-basal body complex protein FliE [Clostridium grantii]SHH83564.1 flagellar hook-basal body complex protein FliE [Clostridium grantii DSM 8605]